MNDKGTIIEIIAVGSELLTPFYQDTDSLYLTQHLNDLGLQVTYKTIVGDDWDTLVSCFKQTLQRADLIFVIGGLGPTHDDRTREAWAEVLQKELIFQEELLEQIKNRFAKHGLIMSSVNKKQAYVIDGAEVLENKNGTAPGLWICEGEKKIALLPGPPHEIKPMFEKLVLPKLKSYQKSFSSRLVLKITGLTESKTESLIADIPQDDPQLQMTILAYPGQIEIHVRGISVSDTNEAEHKVSQIRDMLVQRLEDNIFSENGDSLEKVVGGLLLQNHATLATAESCTGGLLGHRITNVPGSSAYYVQGVQVYSNSAKVQLLGVSPETIEKYGAVSSEVADQMATNVRKTAQANFGLAITGIAGPSGGTPEKPVGLVYTALAWDGGTEVAKNRLIGNREIIKQRSSQKALDMLRRHLLKEQ